MKHLKTTIKLSVLALACLGAGALTLQPTANAKAEDSAACLTMQNGAAVCVSDDFSGIRWTTTINFDQYRVLCGAGKTITFGTLVMPTSQLGDDGVLTEADVNAVDIVANVDVNNLANDTEYYSIINYDKLAEQFTDAATKEESLQKAYGLELTARSYVKVNDTYYFTDMTGISTSRSARQVALAAELAGEWTDEQEAKALKAAGYYGMTERYTPAKVSNGAAGTAYVDLNNGAMKTQEVVMNVDLNGSVQSVFIGAERVEYVSYADKKLTIKVNEGQSIPTGETYVTIFTDNGFVTEPIIGATMVFDEMSDFDMFAKIRENLDKRDAEGNSTESSKIDAEMHNGHVASDYEFDGYYVLAESLTWDAEVDTVKTDADPNMGNGWRGTSKFAETKLGLTGTFNGLGCWIRGYQDSRKHSGLFQLVNGGTIKNLYMYAYTPSITTTEEVTTTNPETNETTTETVKKTTYANYSQTFAHYMIDPTIENVYIYTKNFFSAQSNHYILGNYLYQTEENAAKLSNIYARAFYTDTKNSKNKGGLFGNYVGTNKQGYNWNNVYVVSNLGSITYAVDSKAYIDFNGTEKAVYLPTVKAVAENQKTENGYLYYDINNKHATVEFATTEGGMTATFTYNDVAYPIYTKSGDATTTTHASATPYCLNGVYFFYNDEAFTAALGTYDFSSFTGVNGGNCWVIDEAGKPAFDRAN